jgi:hypothetical protein
MGKEGSLARSGICAARIAAAAPKAATIYPTSARSPRNPIGLGRRSSGDLELFLYSTSDPWVVVTAGSGGSQIFPASKEHQPQRDTHDESGDGVMTMADCVAPFVLFHGSNLSPGVREDRSNRWVLPVFFVLGLLDGFLPPYADRTQLWVIDGEAVRWVGVVLFAAGGALRVWPVLLATSRP